jgi:6-phosphogluconolactonase (cycloisomerase 2 family)
MRTADCGARRSWRHPPAWHADKVLIDKDVCQFSGGHTRRRLPRGYITVSIPICENSENLCSTLVLQRPGAGDFAVRSDTKYLYALTHDEENNTTSVIPYAIDPVTGALTGGAAITFPTNAAGTSMSIDPLGRFLYVANAASPDGITDGTSQSATVVSYALDAMTGAPAPGSSTVVANGASSVAPDPTGRYLYVVYSGCCASYSNVLALTVDASNGALSQIGPAVPISTTPNHAACDPSGAFLFVGNEGAGILTARQSWNDLSSFAIATSGVNAGTVSLSGQGAQFPSGTDSPGTGLAIVE